MSAAVADRIHRAERHALPVQLDEGIGRVEEAGRHGDHLASEVPEGDLVHDAVHGDGAVASDPPTDPERQRGAQIFLGDALRLPLGEDSGRSSAEDAAVGRALIKARQPGP
jgi:hypothetical protein